MSVSVCLCVCVSLFAIISPGLCPIFNKFFMRVTYGRGSVLLWRPSDMFYIYIYTVSQKKQDTKLLPITSPNVNRFSKFFHW